MLRELKRATNKQGQEPTTGKLHMLYHRNLTWSTVHWRDLQSSATNRWNRNYRYL